jgi:hypothetical protein
MSLHKLLVELVSDLKFVDGKSALALNKYIFHKKDKELLKEIKDVNSNLVKLIPIDTLHKDVAGRRYLELLAFLQPIFTIASPIPELIEPSPILELVEPSPIPELTHITEPFANLFRPKDSNRELMNLAQELMSQINLPVPGSQMDMNSMMEMIQQVSGIVQTRIETGDLNAEIITLQAQDLMSEMTSTPEMQNILETTLPDGILGENGLLSSLPEGFDISSIFKSATL